MSKALIWVVVIIIVAVGAYFLFIRPTSDVGQPTPETSDVNVITYTDTGYSPSSLTIKAGEAVTFKNESSRSMWPASAMHPTHKLYPTTGGCIGSTFDACQGVLPGGSWSFQFDVAGEWKYHDHLDPTKFGTIIVE